MLTYEDAPRIALAHAGPGQGLIESATRELPFGWYFEIDAAGCCAYALHEHRQGPPP